MRLFVAAELPPAARDAIDAVERPAGADVRWTAPSSWHVTFRFLGEVPDATAAVEALDRIAAATAVAVVGRTPARLGPTAVVLPVAGLDAIGDAVASAFAALPGADDRPFTGHLTIGRLRRPKRWPAGGVGTLPAEVCWPVEEVALIQSHLTKGPARYEVLARRRLA